MRLTALLFDPLTRASYHLRNLNPRWQKYGMRSHASQQEWACYPLVTGSCQHALSMSFLIITDGFSQLWKGVLHSCGSQLGNQQNAGILHAAGQILWGLWTHQVGALVEWYLGNSRHARCTPTVFRWQWPEDVMANIKTFRNP
jgi:hypothetical protein